MLTSITKEYAEPAVTDGSMDKKSSLAKYLAQGRYPIEQRIENKKRGIGRQRYPFVGRLSSRSRRFVCSILES